VRAPSIFDLIRLAVAAVAVPLALVFGLAIYALQSLGSSNRQWVFAAETATRGVHELADQLAELERSALEFEATRSSAARREYEASRQVFLASLDRVDGADTHARVARLHAEESQLHARLLAASPDTEATLALFRALYLGVDHLLADGRRLVAPFANRSTAVATRVEQALILPVLLLIPIALVLGARLFRRIEAPLHHLEGAVQLLGSGRFDTPIAIDGPRDLAELGCRLEWLRERLLALEAQKTRFLQHVSHELKTPLASIREGANLLCDESPDEDARDHRQIAHIVHQSSIRLQYLIERLLDLSRVEAIARTQARTSLRFDDVVRSVLAEHRIAIGSRDLRLETSLASVELRGSPSGLATLVDNLVSNAVRFCSAHGFVGVRLGVEGAWVVLEVTDTGPGVPCDERDRVFELCYQGHARAAGPVQGSGFGLAIAQEVARRHGGRIDVVDVPVGACFRVRLPLEDRSATDVEMA
jgi:two-component system sensor histidine kinase GlrK